MNKKRDNQDYFDVMRKIQKQPKTSQRDLAQQLGFSLGKLNYCVKALQQKGLIKIKNFEKNPNGKILGCVKCNHGRQNHDEEFRASARMNEELSQKRDSDFG